MSKCGACGSDSASCECGALRLDFALPKRLTLSFAGCVLTDADLREMQAGPPPDEFEMPPNCCACSGYGSVDDELCAVCCGSGFKVES